MKKPLVSIIILTYAKQLAHTKKCLLSLKKVTYPHCEIVLVDNASTDNTVAYVRKYFPHVKLIENKENLGFCEGNNIGLSHAKGKYILFLNNDIEVTPPFLEPLVKELEDDKTVGVIQPKMRQMIARDKLDACASFLTVTGFLYHYGYSQKESEKKYNKKLFMYSAKGACFLTRKDLIERIGLFDPDYFAYFEETDFCHRVWLAGFSVVYDPTSEVYHLGGVGKNASAFMQFHSYKNRIQTYIKNCNMSTLLSLLPVHILFCLSLAAVYLYKGNLPYFSAIVKSLWWNIINLKMLLIKRKYVQKNLRKVEDSDFLAKIQKRVSLSYFIHFLQNPRGYYNFKKI